MTTFDQARAARDQGMQQALEHAEEVTPNWSETAYQYLVNFTLNSTGTFISEDVSDAAAKDPNFPAPPTDRAWGSIYLKAERAGWIKRAGYGRSRRRHASVCIAWEAA